MTRVKGKLTPEAKAIRKELKDLGYSSERLAGFFELSHISYQNSSARERYERAISRALENERLNVLYKKLRDGIS